MAIFAMISLLAHLSVAYVLGLIAPFDLTAPVFPTQAISIILKGPKLFRHSQPEKRRMVYTRRITSRI